MPIATTTTICSNHHHCHPHHHQQQASAAAVTAGQLVVVVRMVDDLWYMVLFFFQWRSTAQQQRRLYRTNVLLSRIKDRNRGIWCVPRVVPVLRERIFGKMLKTPLGTLSLTLTLTPTPPHIKFVRKKSGFFWGGEVNWSTTLKVVS